MSFTDNIYNQPIIFIISLMIGNFEPSVKQNIIPAKRGVFYSICRAVLLKKKNVLNYQILKLVTTVFTGYT